MTSNTSVHVDEFIETPTFSSEPNAEDVKFAKWFFLFKRLPATMQIDFGQFFSGTLFCVFEDGVIYRVTGASRMGDIWLATNYGKEEGYDKRVSLEKVKLWIPGNRIREVLEANKDTISPKESGSLLRYLDVHS